MKQINKKLFALLLGTIFTFPVYADKHEAMDRQGQFMAVYLFHFANFIEWPDSAFNNIDSFNICINGKTEINKYISDIEEETVKGRKIKILKNISSDGIKNCQILFVSRNGYKRNKIEKHLFEKNILLVSDQESFIAEGGVIQYYIENNKLRLKINNDLAERMGLKISSKLLRIAKVVGGQ